MKKRIERQINKFNLKKDTQGSSSDSKKDAQGSSSDSKKRSATEQSIRGLGLTKAEYENKNRKVIDKDKLEVEKIQRQLEERHKKKENIQEQKTPDNLKQETFDNSVRYVDNNNTKYKPKEHTNTTRESEQHQNETEQKILEKKALEEDCQALYSLFKYGQSTYLEEFREKSDKAYDKFLNNYKNIHQTIQFKNENSQILSDKDYSDIKDLKEWLMKFSKGIETYSEAHKEHLEDFKTQEEALKRFLGYQNVRKLCKIEQNNIRKIIKTYEYNQNSIEKWISALKEFPDHNEHIDAQKIEKSLKDYAKKIQQAKSTLNMVDTIPMLADMSNTVTFIDKALAEPEKDLLNVIHKLSEQEKITLEPRETTMEEID